MYSTFPIVDAANGYREKGFSVFPCNTNKKPATPHGFHDATCDEALVTTWFTKIPGAMIGLPTGHVNGFVIIDCDGDEGIANFAALCEANGYSPVTLTASTPGGGLHYYFAAPLGIEVPCSTSKLARNVDVRGDGGYVIAPPSLAPNGKRYEWLCRQSVAELPEWMLLRLCAKGKGLITQAK